MRVLLASSVLRASHFELPGRRSGVRILTHITRSGEGVRFVRGRAGVLLRLRCLSAMSCTLPFCADPAAAAAPPLVAFVFGASACTRGYVSFPPTLLALELAGPFAALDVPSAFAGKGTCLPAALCAVACAFACPRLAPPISSAAVPFGTTSFFWAPAVASLARLCACRSAACIDSARSWASAALLAKSAAFRRASAYSSHAFASHPRAPFSILCLASAVAPRYVLGLVSSRDVYAGRMQQASKWKQAKTDRTKVPQHRAPEAPTTAHGQNSTHTTIHMRRCPSTAIRDRRRRHQTHNTPHDNPRLSQTSRHRSQTRRRRHSLS